MQVESKAKPKWTKKKKMIVAFIVVVVVIATPIFARLFWEIHEAGKAFSTFNQALVAKDYPKAYALTTPELKTNVSYDAFVGVQSGLATRVGALRSFDSIQTEVRDDENGYFATIRSQLVFERGSLPFVFVLKKENGSWLVNSFKEQ